jgi:hypothetical protein
VHAAVPDGVDLLLDGAGGQTRDQVIGTVRDGGLRGSRTRPLSLTWPFTRLAHIR